jgi:hypothetical protein
MFGKYFSRMLNQAYTWPRPSSSTFSWGWPTKDDIADTLEGADKSRSRGFSPFFKKMTIELLKARGAPRLF